MCEHVNNPVNKPGKWQVRLTGMKLVKLEVKVARIQNVTTLTEKDISAKPTNYDKCGLQDDLISTDLMSLIKC